MVKGGRNIGEAGVLALLCDAVDSGLLTVKLVSALADDLLATEYRLPFKPGRFEAWAIENDRF